MVEKVTNAGESSDEVDADVKATTNVLNELLVSKGATISLIATTRSRALVGPRLGLRS